MYKRKLLLQIDFIFTMGAGQSSHNDKERLTDRQEKKDKYQKNSYENKAFSNYYRSSGQIP